MRQSWCQRVHGGTWHKQPIQDLVPMGSSDGSWQKFFLRKLPGSAEGKVATAATAKRAIGENDIV